MHTQSFSPENFKKILDNENKKGNHLEEKLSLNSIKVFNEYIKECNQKISNATSNQEKQELFDKKQELRRSKENQVNKILKDVSSNIFKDNFKLVLVKKERSEDKPIYEVPSDPEHFFTLKQIQQNISRLFKVKQANRFLIVNQLIPLLNDFFPKIVIRTDIKDFYESIPHNKLLNKINNDNLLTPYSRKILKQILDYYKNENKNDVGLPRGIGVSAYLAELFMREIDSEIKNLKGVSYYARYVDDIVVVFTPWPNEESRNYLEEIKHIVEKNMLSLNPDRDKTNIFDLTNGYNKEYKMYYLGYNFIFGKDNIKVKMSDNKIDKYKNRLKKAFEAYKNCKKDNEKTARQLLVKRVRFLCSNTKLTNNKSNTLVGIYYSNRHITKYEDLEKLDRSLYGHIENKVNSPRLKKRLKHYSFLEGFKARKFAPFTPNDLKNIMKIWNNT